MARTRFGSLDGIHHIKKNSDVTSIIISAVLFLAIIIGFLFVVSKLSTGSIEKQQETLYEAIDNGIIQCYVTEGRYPQDFEYLKENYGIIYDEDRFRIDYFIYGSNMKPMVTIIQLED